MSWLPEFELGWWNAWILLLYFPLHPLIFLVVDKIVGTGQIMKKMGNVPFEKGEKVAAVFSMLATLFLLVYAIFLPLQLGTAWFYAGLVMYLIGLAMFLAAIVNIATTPLGQPFRTGMYRYSRHPMSLGSSLTFIGAGIACASWLFVLLAIINAILDAFLVVAEERRCLEIYGDDYQDYLDQTSRWLGRPKAKSGKPAKSH